MAERNLKASILTLLHEHHLLSTKSILEHLEQEGRSYNKTSAYRALEQLHTEGVVCRHYFNDAEATYELKEHHHAHVVCQNCGKVAVAECNYTQPDKISGFTIDHHHLTLIGMCDSCLKNQSLA